MVSKALFSSATDDWETPQWLFDALDREFGFELDVCASAENSKCDRYFDLNANGLEQDWSGVCWMNPPYGKHIALWMEKAVEAAKQGATVVCLVPARTCSRWWHQYAMQGEIRFLRGRLRFGQAKNSAPFPSAILVLRPTNYRLKVAEMRKNP